MKKIIAVLILFSIAFSGAEVFAISGTEATKIEPEAFYKKLCRNVKYFTDLHCKLT